MENEPEWGEKRGDLTPDGEIVWENMGKPIITTIGQWADFFCYDPDGIAGPPTPKDPALEDRIFGKGLMKMYRELEETNA